MVKSANAQTTPTLSVPEFTLKYNGNSSNPTIVITIENQPPPNASYQIYFNIRVRDNLEGNWTELYHYTDNSTGNLPIQTNLPYTTLYYLPENSSGTLDFQVEAIRTHYIQYISPNVPLFQHPTEPWVVVNSLVYGLSGWSNIQTVTLSSATPSPTLTPSPTPGTPTSNPPIPSFLLALIAIFLAFAVIIIILYIKAPYRKRISKQIAHSKFPY
jgi:hypothetical protein